MKQKFFIGSLAVLALMASCSSESDSVSPVSPDSQISTKGAPIAFGTYLSKGTNTRAGATGSINTTGALKASAGFGVFAYYTQDKNYDAAGESQTPNWMYNQKVAWDNTKNEWMYSPLKYWPNDNTIADDKGATGTTSSKVSFFAYAPFAGDPATGAVAAGETSGITAFSANDSTGHPTVTYKLAADGKQVDLLWGTAAEGKTYETVTGSNVTVKKVSDAALAPTNLNLQKLKTGQKIMFLFKHALAKFGGSGETTKTNSNGTTETVTTTNGLQVKLDIDKDGAITGGDKDDATKVTIKNIEIVNKNSTATNPEDLNGDGTADDNDKIVSGGTFDLATGLWTASTKDYVDIDHTITSPGSKTGTGSETERSNATIADTLAEPATVATGTAGWDALPTGVTTTAQNVYQTESNPLVFIPGTRPSFKITVEYVVRTKDAHLAKGYTEAVQKITHNVAFQDAVQVNKKYNLLIHLGLTSVKFEATVSNWDLDSTPAGGTGTEDSDGEGTPDSSDKDIDVHVPINVQ